MAQRVLINFVDDIDGTEAEGTVKFGLDGAEYEIDLSAANNDKLHQALGRYVEGARRVTLGKVRVRPRTAGGGRVSAQAPGVSSEEIRTWAKQRGYKVNERGRIPTAIVAEFNASRNGGSTVQNSTAPAALQQPPPKEDLVAVEEEPATVKSGPARGGRKPAANDTPAPVVEADAAPATPAKRPGRKPKGADAAALVKAMSPEPASQSGKYDQALKDKAVRRVLDDGGTIAGVARDLKVTESSLRNWVKAARASITA